MINICLSFAQVAAGRHDEVPHPLQLPPLALRIPRQWSRSFSGWRLTALAQEIAMPQYTSPRPMNLALRKPRNPCVAPALLRQAGRHQSPRDAVSQRRSTRTELAQQLRQLAPPDDSP